MSESNIKSKFAGRLHEICDDMGLPKERGRTAAVAKKFNVSHHAASKWLDGVGFPETETIIEMANWSGVNINWLLQGVGPKKGNIVDSKSLILGEAIESLPRDERQQVLDFIGYKFEKSDGSVFVGERLARYMAMLDKFKQAPK